MTEKAFYKTVIKQAKWAITKQTKDNYICWNLDAYFGWVKTTKPQLLKVIKVIVKDTIPDWGNPYKPFIRTGTELFKKVRIDLLNEIIQYCESKLSNNA